MAEKTLSRKILDIVGNDPDGFGEAEQFKVEELLRPASGRPSSGEANADNVKWLKRKGFLSADISISKKEAEWH